MPYPLGSSWNDPPTGKQLTSIREAWHRLNYDYTEKDMPATKWQARDLQYELWGKVRALHSKKISGSPDTRGGIIAILIIGAVILLSQSRR